MTPHRRHRRRRFRKPSATRAAGSFASLFGWRPRRKKKKQQP